MLSRSCSSPQMFALGSAALLASGPSMGTSVGLTSSPSASSIGSGSSSNHGGLLVADIAWPLTHAGLVSTPWSSSSSAKAEQASKGMFFPYPSMFIPSGQPTK
eukprot:TRINITY_DN464_c0_g1_i1.p2 TRINITY_DN464_c0_g1~~TRINITY_DN464_c0_g1_i1.p2  ORF type:complete len:103 (+),score=27.88 TRINITY_DN464_c0_g1_i1:135-443(+)